MTTDGGPPQLIIGPMLRHVGRTTATVWMEVDRPCAVSILGHQARTFSIGGHHYALVIIDGLTPGSSTRYEVHLDGRRAWPDDASRLPPSRIRTLGDGPLRVVFGSCRTAAPHEPPWTLEMAIDTRGRGVDALVAHATRMIERPAEQWPHLAVMLGDQIYADDSSPAARERIAAVRAGDPNDLLADLPPELVGDFEEYTWLYQEAWTGELERWFFSVVPSVMIFDDHEMVDDWNISAAWLDDIRTKAWWPEHVTGGLMTYWIHQHLGNLSPDEIRDEGILDALLDSDDATSVLRRWAIDVEAAAGRAGGYRFSVWRDLGRVRLVVIDSRHARVLEPGARQMVNDEDWAWISERCAGDVDHVLLGTSLPVFVPGGMHDLQQWSEALCDGHWGRWAARLGEKLRRAVDMEDWAAFGRSFDAINELIRRLAGSSSTDGRAPSSITVLSGDIHFSYWSEVHQPGMSSTSRVHQLVNSPIRNALRPHERTLMRLAMSPIGAIVGRGLRRAIGRRRATPSWRMDRGPAFDNCLGEIVFNGRSALLTQEQSPPSADGSAPLRIAWRAELGATDVRA